MKSDSDPPVRWSVAEAKQRLSEVLRLAAREPQPIYNRGRLVAALVDADAFAAFERWRREAGSATVGAQFEALRAALSDGVGQAAASGGAAVPLPGVPRADRPNAFAAMLEEEFPARGDATEPGRPKQVRAKSGRPKPVRSKPGSPGLAAASSRTTGRTTGRGQR